MFLAMFTIQQVKHMPKMSFSPSWHKKLVKNAEAVSEEQKLARSSVGSNYPLKYLSPATKAKRVTKVCRERVTLTAKLAKVAHFDVEVSEKQHTELLELVRSVHKNGSKAIEELCAEGEQVLGTDSPLREVWLLLFFFLVYFRLTLTLPLPTALFVNGIPHSFERFSLVLETNCFVPDFSCMPSSLCLLWANMITWWRQ